jgi:sulfatase maturation enzyme AslB (radical SAM superfamily)
VSPNRASPRASRDRSVTCVLFPISNAAASGSALFEPVSLRVVYLSQAETDAILSDSAERCRLLDEIGWGAQWQVEIVSWPGDAADAPAGLEDRDFIAGVRQRLRALGITGQPRAVSSFRIVLTDRCNMACSYCFVDTNTGKPDITLDEILDGSALLLDSNAARDNVTYQWFGGEPLMRKDLILEADAVIRDMARERRVARLRPTIVTNGTILNERLIKHFVEFGYGVGVSIDAPPDENAKYRRFLNGRRTEALIESNIAKLLHAGVYTGANVTPTSENWSDLQRTVDYVLALGIKFIYVNSPIPKDGYWVSDGAGWARQLQKARLSALSRGAMVFSHIDRIYQAIDTRQPRVYEHLQECGGVNVALLPGGRISVLDLNWREPDLIFPVETVRRDPSVLAKARKELFPIADCRSCIAAAICGGPSVNDRRLTKSERPTEQYCRFFREGTRLSALDASGLQ